MKITQNFHAFSHSYLQITAFVSIFLLFFFPKNAFSQQKNFFWNYKWVKAPNFEVTTDTLTILKIQVEAPQNAKNMVFVFDAQNKKIRPLTPKGGINDNDSILISYQYLGFSLQKTRFQRDIKLFNEKDTYAEEYFRRTQGNFEDKREEFVKWEGIQKNGSLTRGISLGNTQNVFVNSALNLQLSGKLSDKIGIKASISDQNIPYQPEGNTLQLQTLDRIFIELSHPLGVLTAGDIVLQQKDNYFLKFYKNVQGGRFESTYFLDNSKKSLKIPLDSTEILKNSLKKRPKGITSVSGAVAKGKFASQVITALEGVQGAYRLVGVNGERFLIVLANSEKVFVDGNLLTRGFNNDYVIDYNQAEITFTQKVLITQFTRIRVDFEYAERNYSRSMYAFSQEFSTEKWQILGQFYREGDNPNQDFLGLTDKNKQDLANLGNNLGQIAGIDSVGYKENEILYRVVDSTTANGTYKRVFVYSTNTQNAFFRLSFLDVGANKGDYIRVNGTTNGQIYRWVEPRNGIKQGNYAPLKNIPTPNRKQMGVISAKYQLNKHENLFLETAFSDWDLNLFSKKDDQNNQGFGYKIGYENKGKPLKKLKNNIDENKIIDEKLFLPKDTLNILKKEKKDTLNPLNVLNPLNFEWFSLISLEQNSQNFRLIDRFRAIEYDRDWYTRTDTSNVQDNILLGNIGVRKGKDFEVKYQFSARQRQNEVAGTQHQFNFFLNNKFWLIKTQIFYLNSEINQNSRTNWTRIDAEINRKLSKNQTLSYIYTQDKHLVNNITQNSQKRDSISVSLMNFNAHQFGYIYTTEKKFLFKITHTLRTDNKVLLGDILPYLRSETTQAQLNYTPTDNHQILLQSTYRLLHYTQNAFTLPIEPTENLTARLDWNISTKKRIIKSELTFATNTGRELRREYEFVLVQVGQGTHTWRDDNGDGIQDLNEFYLAINPDERRFIKVFLPNINYINAFQQNFSYRLQIELPQEWRKKDAKIWQKFLGKWSNNTAWTIQRKFIKDDFSTRMSPFQFVEDEKVLSEQENLRTTFFFQRVNLRYGAEIFYQKTQQKQLLTNGFEARNREEMRILYRYTYKSYWQGRMYIAQSNQQNFSDFLLTRNYVIRGYAFSKELAYQPTPEFRISVTYIFAPKNNPQGTEKNSSQQYSTEIRWQKNQKTNFLLNLKYIQNNYNAENNTPLAYDMLEALAVGTNYTFSLNWQQKLSNGLQLTLNYEGRRSPPSPWIHLGRVQVSFLF